jgi:outer membrane lipoprotein
MSNGIVVRWLLAALLVSLLGSGCAWQESSALAGLTDSLKGPTLAAVRANPDLFIGRKVHWGGRIVQVENRRNETLIELVAQPLTTGGQPRDSGISEGRFIARLAGFVDPAIYAAGRQLTVTGKLEAAIERPIGEYPYRFPVVTAESYRLWEERRTPEVIYYPDPFWYPRSPWYW